MPSLVTFTQAALNDLLRINDYLRLQAGPEVATRFTQKIYQRCLSLEVFPHRYSQLGEEQPLLRMAPVGEYRIIYRPDAHVLIVRVLHQRQDVTERHLNPEKEH